MKKTITLISLLAGSTLLSAGADFTVRTNLNLMGVTSDVGGDVIAVESAAFSLDDALLREGSIGSNNGNIIPNVNIGSGGTWNMTFHYDITANNPFEITHLTLTFVTCTANGEHIEDEEDRTVTFTARIRSKLDNSILATASGNNRIYAENEDGDNEFLFPTLDKTLTVKFAEGVTSIEDDFYIDITTTAKNPSADTPAFYGLQTITLKGHDVAIATQPDTPGTEVAPEPTTTALSLLALAGLAARRRRQA